MDDVGRGQIKPADRLYELKALQEQEKKVEVRYKSDRGPGDQLIKGTGGNYQYTPLFHRFSAS